MGSLTFNDSVWEQIFEHTCLHIYFLGLELNSEGPLGFSAFLCPDDIVQRSLDF